MWRYERRLRRDLARWQQAGWVSEAGARAIAAELDRPWAGVGIAPALAMLGAVMLGFAAMSFVAANWQHMTKLARLVMLFASVWTSYAIAAALLERGKKPLAEAAILLGCALFGASIMLIAQMYHMDGNPPDAVLTWAGGTLLAGLVLRSNAALAFAMVLAVVWNSWETTLLQGIHWGFLPMWAAISAGFVWQRWLPGLHLAALAAAYWIVELGFVVNNGHAHELVAVIGGLIAAAALAAEVTWRRWAELAASVLAYGTAVCGLALMILQFGERPSTAGLVALALLTLAITLGVIVWGTLRSHRGLLWLGYAGFSAEVLGLYFKTIASLMGSSLFFLTTGLVIIALSGIVWRLHARLSSLTEMSK